MSDLPYHRNKAYLIQVESINKLGPVHPHSIITVVAEKASTKIAVVALLLATVLFFVQIKLSF